MLNLSDCSLLRTTTLKLSHFHVHTHSDHTHLDSNQTILKGSHILKYKPVCINLYIIIFGAWQQEREKDKSQIAIQLKTCTEVYP